MGFKNSRPLFSDSSSASSVEQHVLRSETLVLVDGLMNRSRNWRAIAIEPGSLSVSNTWLTPVAPEAREKERTSNSRPSVYMKASVRFPRCSMRTEDAKSTRCLPNLSFYDSLSSSWPEMIKLETENQNNDEREREKELGTMSFVCSFVFDISFYTIHVHGSGSDLMQ